MARTLYVARHRTTAFASSRAGFMLGLGVALSQSTTSVAARMSTRQRTQNEMSDYIRRGDTYRTLSDEEKVRFRSACIDEDVNPRKRCPLCRKRRLTTDAVSRYDNDNLDWVHYGTQVDCHTCRIRYIVVNERAAA